MTFIDAPVIKQSHIERQKVTDIGIGRYQSKNVLLSKFIHSRKPFQPRVTLPDSGA